MAIKINREMAGDLNNPSSELLNHCINQHQSDFWRLEKLSDYYDGKQDILKRTKDSAAAPNNKVVVNHAKYVTDMNVGFMVGNPVAYTSSDDIQSILDAYTKVDIVSHDTELEKDLSVFGIGYELIYMNQEPQTGKYLLILNVLIHEGYSSLRMIRLIPILYLQYIINQYITFRVLSIIILLSTITTIEC